MIVLNSSYGAAENVSTKLLLLSSGTTVYCLSDASIFLLITLVLFNSYCTLWSALFGRLRLAVVLPGVRIRHLYVSVLFFSPPP